MLVVGIDPSARKIAIVADHRTLHVQHVKSYVLYKASEKQTPESMGRALDAMDEFVAWADTVSPRTGGQRYAWVEDPLVGRGVTATLKQAFIGGIIRATLVRAGFEVQGVNVSTWKAQVVGDGKATKAKINTHVKRAWPKVSGLAGSDGDLVDAAAINLYGRGVLATKAVIDDAGLAGSQVRRGRSRKVVRPPRL